MLAITQRIIFLLDIHSALRKLEGVSDVRRVVRYRNRKLYEPAERRFVTIGDLARSVAAGGRVEVIEADSGEDITARTLSRALASGATGAPSADALTRLLRAGSDAAATVAGVVERVGGARMADSMRRAAAPEKLVETFAPLSRRVEDARKEMERIVSPELAREVADLRTRIEQLEELATRTFPPPSHDRVGTPHVPTKPKTRGKKAANSRRTR